MFELFEQIFQCKPRELDYDRARKLQQENIRRRPRTRPDGTINQESNSTEAGSTDDDDTGTLKT